MNAIRPDIARDTTNLHILVVEDESLIAMDMEDILLRLGCSVATAGWITEGLHLIETWRFDGAFLDLDVSGSSILPVAESLSERNIPFAFVTGSGREHVPVGFRNRFILSKPFAERRVAEVVAEFSLSAR